MARHHMYFGGTVVTLLLLTALFTFYLNDNKQMEYFNNAVSLNSMLEHFTMQAQAQTQSFPSYM